MLKIVDLLALLFYCGFIYHLSDQPSLPVPQLFEHQDKVHHLLAYFTMGVLAWRGFRHYITAAPLLMAASVAFCSLYGISDEWHQSFVDGRTADALDWLADTIGATIAAVILSCFSSYPKPN
ncbi:MAG: VanZ family protein [Gammaproteobacteria bacterium]|nr:VanZ family protein [Gammaproteobacteria bacterium]